MKFIHISFLGASFGLPDPIGSGSEKLTHTYYTHISTNPKPKVHTVYATYHPTLAITSHYAGYSASAFNFTWKHLNLDSGFMCVLIASLGVGGGGQRHFSCRQSNKDWQSPIILRQPKSLFYFSRRKRCGLQNVTYLISWRTSTSSFKRVLNVVKKEVEGSVGPQWHQRARGARSVFCQLCQKSYESWCWLGSNAMSSILKSGMSKGLKGLLGSALCQLC